MLFSSEVGLLLSRDEELQVVREAAVLLFAQDLRLGLQWHYDFRCARTRSPAGGQAQRAAKQRRKPGRAKLTTEPGSLCGTVGFLTTQPSQRIQIHVFVHRHAFEQLLVE
jgi:hypothetical protein